MKTKQNSCKNCYFYDECGSSRICGFYSPLDDEPSDAYIKFILESERKKYREDFIEYISEYDDDLFY